jgi:hypothetical protein
MHSAQAKLVSAIKRRGVKGSTPWPSLRYSEQSAEHLEEMQLQYFSKWQFLRQALLDVHSEIYIAEPIRLSDILTRAYRGSRNSTQDTIVMAFISFKPKLLVFDLLQ